MTDFAARIERAAAAAADAGLAGVIAGPGADLQYLTGYTPSEITERLTALVVSAGREPVLVLPGFEAPAAAGVGVPLLEWSDGEDPYALAAARLAPGRYAVSDALWALHVVALQEAGAALTSMTASLPLLRAVKDDDELAVMRAAGAAADATFLDVVELPFAGRREEEVAADLARLLVEHGHASVEFTIVGSGPNGANPHHEAGARVIEYGDAVVLDFGGVFDGYGSDTTRTVFVGEPSEEQRRVHDVVRAAQQAGYEAVRPGATCQDVDRAARAVITDAGYGEFFTHRTGHGIGIDVHEPPYIIEGSTQVLEPGMCFSVEPGVYLPGAFGVRIEDIVAVTDHGARRLNEAPRSPRIVA